MEFKLKTKKSAEQIEVCEKSDKYLEGFEKKSEQPESEHRGIFNTTPDGILLTDLTGFIKSCNEAFLKITGYSKEEIVGKHFTQLPTIRLEDTTKYIKLFSSIIRGKKINHFVFKWIDKDGNTRFGETHASLTRESGQITGAMAILKDTTNREKIALAIKESEKNLKTYLESAPDTVFISDLKGTFLYGNRKAEELTGYTREELLGKSFFNLTLLPKKYLAKAAEQLALCAIGKPTGPDEYQLTTKSGDHVWVEISTTPIKENGKTIVMGFVRDIKERKRADEKRQAILKTAIDGFWISDISGKILEVNDSYCQMTGYSREELLKMSIKDVEALETQKDVNQRIEKITEQGHDRFETQHRRKDGKIIDIEISVNHFKAEKEQLFVFARDITERKRAEKEIEASEERYRLLVENANQAIVVVQDGVLKFINTKTLEQSGYTKEELLSLPFINIIHPDDRQAVIERYSRRLKGETPPGLCTFRCVHKDGTVNWVQMNAVLIDWEGKPATLNFICDITERILTENELRQSYETLQKTVDGTIRTIALIAETRDPYTTGHQRRVAKLASAIAMEMGLANEQVETIRVAGTLHDIGKVNVPIEILSKTDKISEIEFRLVKNHPQAAIEMLKPLELPWTICPIILQHHERMNGSGYPGGISGENICIGARVLAVADVVEAMSSHRPYRRSLGLDKALDEILKNKGILYDEQVVEACLRLFKEKGFKFDEECGTGRSACTYMINSKAKCR